MDHAGKDIGGVAIGPPYPRPGMSAPGALRPPSARPALVTGLLGFLVPGLGHLFVGRPGKALLYFVVVVGTYALGLRLGEFLCVNREREPYWFLGQVLAGGPTAAALHLTKDLVVTHRVPFYDLGLLYTTAAGLLNAVAVADALGIADERRATRAAFFAATLPPGTGGDPAAEEAERARVRELVRRALDDANGRAPDARAGEPGAGPGGAP